MINPAYGKEHFLLALANCFQHDPLRYVVPKLPYVDGLGRHRVIDYAIISRSPESSRIAIIIRPNEEQMSDSEKRELDSVLAYLRQQNWVPVILRVDEITEEALNQDIPSKLQQKIEESLAVCRLKIQRHKHLSHFIAETA